MERSQPRVTNIAARILATTLMMVSAGAACALQGEGGYRPSPTEEIVNASLDAHGGSGALASVESVRETGTFWMSISVGDQEGRIEGSFESVSIPNQRLYQRFDSDVFHIASGGNYQRIDSYVFHMSGGWNGVTAWANTDGMVTDLTETEVTELAMDSWPHPFWAYGASRADAPKFSRLADAELNGRNHHVVQVNWLGVYSQVFVDADTMLVSRIKRSADDVLVTVDMYDYEEHGGVMWALGSRVETQGIPATVDVRTSVIEVNGEVDHSIFDRP